MSGEDLDRTGGKKKSIIGYYASDEEYERDLEGNKSHYVLETCFSHPYFRADLVAEGLAWDLSFVAAEAACGAAAPSRGCEAEERTFYRYFFRHLTGVLEHIERRRPFVEGFLATGGAILFTLRLYGGGNIGDALPPETLMRMAKVGVRLRIEVVPVWPEG
jgi:hypothetical protein